MSKGINHLTIKRGQKGRGEDVGFTVDVPLRDDAEARLRPLEGRETLAWKDAYWLPYRHWDEVILMMRQLGMNGTIHESDGSITYVEDGNQSRQDLLF